MSLLQQYSAFLARPGEEHLLATATLSYVPTLTTLTGASAVVRHLAAQAKALHKKSETVLTAVAGVEADGQTLVVEMDTTLEFLSGGGAYLPGLDDNFVAGRLAAFPITHFVHFRGQQISSVRLAWDQGSLLKQIDVIGSRGRNWPIRDGKDQARLIASIARASTAPLSSQPDGPSAAADSARGRAYSGKGATADPHATLSLFQSEEEHRAAAAAAPTTRRQNDDSSSRPAVAPRQSAKPPSRDYGALFAGADSEPAAASGLPGPGHGQGDGYGGQARAVAATPVKAGAGKNFRPNRLFEETAEERAAAVPDKFRANPHKYSHFEFGEPDADATPRARAKRQSTDEKAAKHSSQWDFTDFATPSKPAAKVNSHNVRHFGWSDDEDVSFFFFFSSFFFYLCSSF